MATDLPKVQGYVPENVYAALEAYRSSNNLKSMSLAVAYVLAEFFGVSLNSDSSVNRGESLAVRVEMIEGK